MSLFGLGRSFFHSISSYANACRLVFSGFFFSLSVFVTKICKSCLFLKKEWAMPQFIIEPYNHAETKRIQEGSEIATRCTRWVGIQLLDE
jgi:hypothetical protein